MTGGRQFRDPSYRRKPVSIRFEAWIPAFAGMTRAKILLGERSKVSMSTQVLMPEPRGTNINWSQLSLVAVAGVAALSILLLLGMIVWMSLRTGVPGQASDYSLKNYAAILADPYTYKVMWTTLYFSAVTIAVAVPLGFVFAWLVERTDMPYKALAMSLLSIGILFPTFLKAMGWVFLLHPRIGVINIFLMQLFGLAKAPLNIATLTGIGWVQGLTLTPLAYVMISAALKSMNPSLVEAASVHGVSQWRTLVRIELPLIWPALFSAVIWMFTVAIAAFDVPGVIGMANNIFTFSTAIYFMINPNEGLPRYGLSGAYGTIMVGLSLILMIPYFIALKQSHKYQIISGKAYQPRPVELGRWRWSAWGLLGIYFTLAFVLPLLAIFWVSLLPYVQAPSWQALSTLDLRALLDGGLRQRDLGSGDEYRAPDGRGADTYCFDLRGRVVDRHALEIALAGGLGRRGFSAASGAQLALRSGNRLLGAAGVQRRAALWDYFCHHGRVCHLLDQLRHPGVEQQHDPGPSRVGRSGAGGRRFVF